MKGMLTILITVVLITITLFFKFFYFKNVDYSEINEYLNTKYILSIDEKELLSNRLKNATFFNYCKDVIEENAEVRIDKDDKDGNAWGTISLLFDKNFEDDLKKILLQTGEEICEEQRTYGIIDEYGSIYIEKSYLYGIDDKIKLVFSVKLPYKYNFNDNYDENIRFFLKINEES